MGGWGVLAQYVPPCVTFRLVVVPLRGPGQSPILPFACCVGLLLLPAAAAGALAGVVSAFAEPSSWCVGAVLNVEWCAVCASAAPNSCRIGGGVWPNMYPPPPPPRVTFRPSSCVTFRLSLVAIRGPRQSPDLPFTECVRSLLSTRPWGWYVLLHVCVHGAQYLVRCGCGGWCCGGRHALSSFSSSPVLPCILCKGIVTC